MLEAVIGKPVVTSTQAFLSGSSYAWRVSVIRSQGMGGTLFAKHLILRDVLQTSEVGGEQTGRWGVLVHVLTFISSRCGPLYTDHSQLTSSAQLVTSIYNITRRHTLRHEPHICKTHGDGCSERSVLTLSGHTQD